MTLQNSTTPTPEGRNPRREAIMDAALRLFGASGLDATSVEAIARDAGIGKGTIYLYFKSKDEILDAILAERWPGPYLEHQLPEILCTEAVTDVPLEETLVRVGNMFLGAVESNMVVLRLAMSEVNRFPDRAEHLFEHTFLRANRIIATFLEAQEKAGRLRPLESPLIAARCYQSLLMMYVMSQEMLRGKVFTPIEREDWVRVAVDIFLRGIENRIESQTPETRALG
ncbi:MAG: TetR/AcrR family transcriptional regulator [Dehalococcoidia bacterium]|nr:TetR/AcrR family transcriptional regulator [Dehalococcoidia bacterium]